MHVDPADEWSLRLTGYMHVALAQLVADPQFAHCALAHRMALDAATQRLGVHVAWEVAADAGAQHALNLSRSWEMEFFT